MYILSSSEDDVNDCLNDYLNDDDTYVLSSSSRG